MSLPLQSKTLIIFIFVLCVLSIPFWVYLIVSAKVNQYLYKNINDIPQVEYIVVLGTRGNIVEDRIDVAIELFKAKKAPKIIMSGDGEISGSWDFDETLRMADIAKSYGVDDSEIIRDPKGLRTLDTCRNLAINYPGKSVILITQSWHIVRSLYACRNSGVNAYGFTSDPGQIGVKVDRSYPLFQWYFSAFRDIIATSQLVLELKFGPMFKFDYF